jgi:hypothetical protein
MFKRIAILAALAAGTVLLTACNATESVSDARQSDSAGTTADVKLATSEEDSSTAVRSMWTATPTR